MVLAAAAEHQQTQAALSEVVSVRLYATDYNRNGIGIVWFDEKSK